MVKTTCFSGRGRYKMPSIHRWIRIVRQGYVEWGCGWIVSRRQHFRTLYDCVKRLWRTWTWTIVGYNDRRIQRACYVVERNDDLLINNGLQSKRRLCSRSTRHLLDSVHQVQTLRRSWAWYDLKMRSSPSLTVSRTEFGIWRARSARKGISV